MTNILELETLFENSRFNLHLNLRLNPKKKVYNELFKVTGYQKKDVINYSQKYFFSFLTFFYETVELFFHKNLFFDPLCDDNIEGKFLRSQFWVTKTLAKIHQHVMDTIKTFLNQQQRTQKIKQRKSFSQQLNSNTNKQKKVEKRESRDGKLTKK